MFRGRHKLLFLLRHGSILVFTYAMGQILPGGAVASERTLYVFDLRQSACTQSESVALQPGLARDCAAEREQHCAGVQPGQSRVFNCLIANARQVGGFPCISSQLCYYSSHGADSWS